MSQPNALTLPIPVEAGKRIADGYGYDQVVIVARKVGGPEHVTTYGVNAAHCDVAARMGDFFKHKLMGWPTPEPTPIDMVLYCPACGAQHVDAPDREDDPSMLAVGITHRAFDGWTNPPHRSHLCHGCGYIWRPADVPTNGVAAIKTRGKNDSSVVAPAPAAVPERTMFDVAYGPRTVYGQVTLGFVLGVRLPDKDVLVFGATVDETRAAAALLGSELFGVPMVEKRAMLLREGSTK